ncbi:low temperature requirement protein A [Plantactinospora sp. B24E8]|uniref:low temperature requirement protein A n=1 Tax=Plantactinospora sp. B24E8 TaxID=3153567 RepID=UPI00325CB75C
MGRISRARAVPTRAETHRATPFEIFFDLVFVFALTRIIDFMGHPPTFWSMGQGLLLLVLIWFSWAAYTWLGNQVRADVGVIRAGTLLAMAALFVAALVMPDAWRSDHVGMAAPLILVGAYVALRLVHFLLYYRVAVDDPRVRARLRWIAVPIVLAWIPLVLGAVYGGTAQTLLWLLSLLIDIGGQRIALAIAGGWQLRSPNHFSERHGLALIIALGLSLISVGAGAGTAAARAPVLFAALLGLTVTVCLWSLCFDRVGPAAARALAGATGSRRVQIASDAYSLAYLLLVSGIIYLALGIGQVVEHLAHKQPDSSGGEPLSWASTTALFGGVALHLTGRLLSVWFSVRSAPPAQLGTVVVTLLLLPVGRMLPALAALGLVVAVLVVAVGFERLTHRSEPAAP